MGRLQPSLKPKRPSLQLKTRTPTHQSASCSCGDTVPPFKPLCGNTAAVASWLSGRGVPSAGVASDSCRLSSSTMCSLSSSSESELASKPLLKFVTAESRQKMEGDQTRITRLRFKTLILRGHQAIIHSKVTNH